MTAPTQALIVQVGDPQHGLSTSGSRFGTAPRAGILTDATPFRLLALDGRSVFASLLAILIFVPGCAAATVLLMRSDDRVTPIAAPRLTAASAKSDRQPPDHWSPNAIEILLSPMGEARIDTATVFEDPALAVLVSGSMQMRGSITPPSQAVADAMALAPAPKRAARPAKPLKVVAEAAPPPPPEPAPPSTLLERLFGSQAD